MKIELIYFDGCPNIKKSRDNIQQALDILGLDLPIGEWDQNNKNAPVHVKGYGSPTVLINEQDISPNNMKICESGNCRIYEGMTGIPSTEIIKKAIEKYL